jgi:lipooligosaccharide transport system permease protein
MLKIWYRDLIVWSHYKGSSLVANLGEPLLYLFALGFGVGRYVNTINGMSYAEFIAPALVAASVMNTATFETTYSSYTRMAVQKTFDAIAVTPLSFRQIILGEILWAATKGCLSGLVILIVFSIARLIHSPAAVMVLGLCFVEGILFASVGMLATATAKSYDFFTYYFTLFISPMFLFSGTFFPLQGLPKYLTDVAWFLPLTHGVNGARAICTGDWGLAFWKEMAWLIVVGVLVNWFAVKKMEKRLYV